MKVRHCPNCRATAEEKHCELAGCPWWRCSLCFHVFDKSGRMFKKKTIEEG